MGRKESNQTNPVSLFIWQSNQQQGCDFDERPIVNIGPSQSPWSLSAHSKVSGSRLFTYVQYQLAKWQIMLTWMQYGRCFMLSVETTGWRNMLN